MKRLVVGLLAVGAWGCGPVTPGVDAGVDAGPEVCVQLLPERFPTSTTLAKGCYLAQTTPVISAAVTLTLSPGVKIVFSPDVGLHFSAEQALLAQGTEAEPIVFTALVPTRGSWAGLSFDGTTVPSRLDWALVEYGGNTTHDRDAAAIKMTADSRGVRLGLTHVTVRESMGWGLYAGGSAVFPQFEANQFTRNTLGPASLDEEVVGVIDPASRFAGNDRDELVVFGSRVSHSATWQTLDVPYFMADSVYLAVADLTLQPGAIFHMDADTGFRISGDTGALIAVGTAEKPILFTGTATRGSWSGFAFDGSNNTRNVIDHATVEWAGNITHDRDAAAIKLTADSHGVQLRLSNVTVRESQGWGLYATGSAVMPQFNGNVLTHNGLGPVSIDSNNAHLLLPTSSFAGNDLDRVNVRAQWVKEAVTWQLLDVPYRLDGNLQPDKVLTIAPGVTLELTDQSSIRISGTDDVAGFHAVGTTALPITITGVTKTAGAWDGLVFDGDNNGANALDHCIIEYGGGGTRFGWKGMIFSASDSHGVTVSVTNSTVRNSATWGIWFNRGQTGSVSGNTYSSNAQGNYYKEP